MNNKTNVDYLQQIVDNCKSPMDSKSKRILERFKGLISKWGGFYIDSINIIGSSVQGTSIRKIAGLDVDLFISVHNDTPYKLSDLHESLKQFLNKNGHKTTTRNFAMKTKIEDISVDLVIARRAAGVKGTRDGYHDVYSTKHKSIVPSNPALHTRIIRKSGKQDVIRLFKRWLMDHELTTPSFLAALVVIESTKKLDIIDGLYNNFIRVLEYISEEFMFARYVDPANHADCLSDQMSDSDKRLLIKQAVECLKQKDLSKVIW